VRNRWRWWLGGGAIAYASTLVLVRGKPTTEADAGVFLSVAARLLRGDRLYADVYDNKGPLFYYTYAGALGILDWRGPFLLDIVWLAIAAVFSALFVRSIGGSRLLAAIAFVLYPFLLTGNWYFAGYARLAALSIVPLIGWLWVRRNFVWAGALICIGMLFALEMTLVLLCVPAALLALGAPSGRRRSQAAHAMAGFAIAVAIAVVFFAVAGELEAYVRAVITNTTYANDVLAYSGRDSGISGHIFYAERAIPRYRAFEALSLLAGALSVYSLVRSWRARKLGATEPIIAALFLSTSLAVWVTLAFTYAWGHHDQVLALPATCLLLVLLSRLELIRPLAIRGAAMVSVLALGVVPLGGTISGTRALTKAQGVSISSWFSSQSSSAATALNQVRRDQVPELHRVTYAHLGRNDEQAHAVFLDNAFDLACPIFHQYPSSSKLGDVLRCVEQKRPQLLLLTHSFAPEAGAPERWNDFVEQSMRLIKSRYVLAYGEANPSGSLQVWMLRQISSNPN
jgi:hypothetical protein